MPRAIWTGSISFGLVNVPVRLYGAISEHKLHFRLVHEPDQSPIGYQEVCKLEDKPVPDDEVVKAFEFGPAVAAARGPICRIFRGRSSTSARARRRFPAARRCRRTS